MTTYYVRRTGSDAAAGTSAGAAWATIGKALGASGIASGDTVYIGAGIYRESVTVAMTSATVETKVVGDITGQYTGDAGEIVWTNYTTSDHVAAVTTAPLILSARDYLTFQNITFVSGSTAPCINAASGSTNINFSVCTFLSYVSGNGISFTNAYGVSGTLSIDRCIFFVLRGIGINITLASGSGADYDVNTTIKNCLVMGAVTGASSGIVVTSSGTSANYGGGVDILNCTIISAGTGVTTTTARISLTYPCTLNNCIIMANTGIVANTSGQLIENYNFLFANTLRTNVTAGAQSISDNTTVPLFDVGQSFLYGKPPLPFMSPYLAGELMCLGNNGSEPSYDLFNRPRPGTQQAHLSNGTASAGGAKTLTDSGKTWGTNAFAGCCVKIMSGTGSGQVKTIASNTATVLTVDGNWNTQPSTDSVYMIFEGELVSSGTATAGGASTLTDGNAAWGTNSWQGYTLNITGGTGSGQTATIASNTGTVLTRTGTWSVNPDNTSTYQIYRGASITAVNKLPGAISVTDGGQKNTGTVRTGSNSMAIMGPGFNEFQFPVDTTSTTITVYTYWDSAYSGTKPSMTVTNGGECGVSDATATATGSPGAWEQLSLNFTPTSAGIVTIRLVSSSTTNDSMTYWDDFAVA